MIRAQGLGFSYPGASGRDGQGALSDVSLEVAPGSLLVLAGSNGSGKSTLFALLAGIFSPGTGTVGIGDCVVGPGAETACLRSVAALVLQDADLQIIGGTAREDMELCFAPDDTAGAARIQEMAERFGLGHCLDEPVQTLSYGQKRKLCLASVLLREPSPSVLLLDEPFAGLDYPAILEMRRILKQGREAGLTQVVAAHDLEPVADLADAMGVLALGRLVLCGTPEAVLGSVREHGVRPPCSWVDKRIGSYE